MVTFTNPVQTEEQFNEVLKSMWAFESALNYMEAYRLCYIAIGSLETVYPVVYSDDESYTDDNESINEAHSNYDEYLGCQIVYYKFKAGLSPFRPGRILPRPYTVM